MRPPPRNLQELLYQKLIDSPAFNNWVRKIHARINRIPYNPHPDTIPKVTNIDMESYKPTRLHRFNAYRIIWVDEMKRSFGLRR
ncbi:uncharacterized protein RJT21DRAFT_118623 [Scheffersomyces amazonensis]|uniref:uncharacterized protein n=1 Tax=Scheffersomyces amazonensis TaxID=1078765 RepID=UPI00315DA25F